MMRYHAPLDDFQKHLNWVHRLCNEAAIKEVIFILDPEEYHFGFPSLDYLRRWVEALRLAKKVLHRDGVIMSINPWLTLGHGGRGYPSPKELGFSATMVGDDGTASAELACPADPAWQKYIANSYALLAEAGPNILWLEDDHRLHNHGAIQFGCFAEPMLQEFAWRSGKQWKRESLVQAIVPGQDKVREQWLRFTGDLWNENVTRIREAVHRVDPAIILGQMTSTMAAHAVEGRRWKEFLRALSGPDQKPVTRPHFGPYRQATGFDFVTGLVFFRHGLAFAGRETRCCPELENWPYSYFSKSRRQTSLMLELCQFFGCRSVTFNFFSLAGNNPFNEPWVLDALKQARPRMDALAALQMEKRKEHGVHVWTHERAACHQVTSGLPPAMNSLTPGFDAWAKVFSHVGVASTFESGDSLTAISGDTIRAAEKNEIRRLLTGGLLLDGRAAQALQDMGYGEFLGVKTIRRQASGEEFPIPIERILDHHFGLKESPNLGVTQLGPQWGNCSVYLQELTGAWEISRLLGAEQKMIGPGVTLFENSLGGRVAVYPFDFDTGPADSVRFYNHPRKLQVQAVLRWLNRENPIVATPEAVQAVVEFSSVEDRQVLAVINLNDDPIFRISLTVSVPSDTKIFQLDDGGRWVEIKEQALFQSEKTLLFPTPLETSQAAFFQWRIST